MIRLIYAAAFISLGLSAAAHEMSPTYPVLRGSHVSNIMTTTMTLFNKRQDIDFYEIGVFDEEWNSIDFASLYKIINVPYMTEVKFDIYIKSGDAKRAEYICSVSKALKNDPRATSVKSRICSRVSN